MSTPLCQEESEHAPPESKDQERRRRNWIVFLYGITTILLFADQNLLAPNLTAIAKEFGFDDDERDKKLGGDIALAFFLLGAPASFVVGVLADKWNRSLLFAMTVGIGEGACLATFFSTTYQQLYVLRAITGFSVGGALPIIFSVLADLYEAQQRPAAAAGVTMGCGIGIAVGQGLAGYLGPTFGWRLPFIVVSAPALICAVVLLLTVKDPERGAKEKAIIQQRERIGNEGIDDSSCGSPCDIAMAPTFLDAQEEKDEKDAYNEMNSITRELEEAVNGDILWKQRWGSNIRTLTSLLSTPTVVLMMLQGAPGCVPWGIVNTYLTDYLATDRGMTVEGATTTVLMFGVGVSAGLVVGGAGGNYLYKINPRYPSLLAGCMAIFGCIPLWILINAIDSESNIVLMTVVSFVSGLGSGVTGPIVKATLQNITLPTSRGLAFALLNTFDDFGRGLGPVFVAMLIVQIGGRRQAFNVGVLGW
eukprot:CAMPEP_0118673436 /NCGR_PEP_ID=MMETSP0800-20121206/317_1 /TAXON_ID=210618 ORGANISM="Striatella unipunctata, Strain CCMP2910" /NCGR_SAMPLE_ID=MMETSP0800 /ASSEMBLY_ACC=CAM_ASM_000638 /LENGTH=475 /DNA_ID=CAMNT_0006568491 /DNA_START=427 /DNA_END=1851 /DNA_ORIENTATION=-